MDDALQLLKDLWPIAVILVGLALALILDRDKKVKKKK